METIFGSAARCICIHASGGVLHSVFSQSLGIILESACVSDHQCTGCNYIHSWKGTVTLRGLNSLGSCFHLLPSLSTGFMVLIEQEIRIASSKHYRRFACKLLFHTYFSPLDWKQSSINKWVIFLQPALCIYQSLMCTVENWLRGNTFWGEVESSLVKSRYNNYMQKKIQYTAPVRCHVTPNLL